MLKSGTGESVQPLLPAAERYLRDWPPVQRDIAASVYANFFRQWAPEWLVRQTAPSMDELYALLDKAWDESPPQDDEALRRYYKHPVWFLNAKYEETHEASITHRCIAVRLAQKYSPCRALDRGGGYGLLLRIAYETLPNTLFDLQDVMDEESLPDELKKSERVRVVAAPEPPYDAVWSIEVFEHLTDPLREAFEINRLLAMGGKLITSYSFYPMIKCHLRRNFHLRHVFHRVLPFLGFRLLGYERPGVTIWVFEKTRRCSKVRLALVKFAVMCSRPVLAALNVLYPILKRG